ncbi:MAG: hypothetical protein A2350_05455 [Candidatus Raymondbacteria bacterium RifOxyB12_full_50_8]|uniref:Amidohydrolase-related domain-containing protein n=1 Tax=Candidatus Raymondbacteria bacterium RIFOXYD12_FULL_49_13 TaxID=1817890 RepID=A0A1F7FIF5_UNCRA|nr:MAG: hypothetical protein A2248_20890 [Candidatus Raymondbacteria bacterium RIFOXYA2_FULL_49_16]OGJ99517.1 MAG: hypothetical protein A2350_05455 [Candidatus Raymondbacteria bacterium RifOxyB12_full_50_8]OGK06246.1 MAG: hypothetical protein A2519_08205 [Candidatus Raymondbacteria bacterium RIFOXYD12_FULL_49_13]OGP40578.1 MAG: hypothetical protein A2324_02960 [Candidatus Raymondbacteria bacterium RIFOXYB2_FULL_49_35]
MMFFDCNVNIGKKTLGFPGTPETIDDLVKEMDEAGVECALVRHYSGQYNLPGLGNKKLISETAANPCLYNCFSLEPDRCRNPKTAFSYLDEIIGDSASAGIIYPASMNISVAEWCLGPLLAAMEQRHLPLFLPYDEIELNDLHGALNNHPELVAVLTHIPYEAERKLISLLTLHGNLHIDISPPYSVFNGIERLCKEIGANRLLFGSFYPEAVMGASVGSLMYADITEEEKTLIGFENMSNLLNNRKA